MNAIAHQVRQTLPVKLLRARKGNGGPRPFKDAPSPSAAKYGRQIHDLRAQGVSFPHIARLLEIPCGSVRGWLMDWEAYNGEFS